MTGTSVIEISESAIASNFEFIRNQVGSDVLISSVVKANAYGHGVEVYGPAAEKAGIRHFSVFSADEGRRLLEIVSPGSAIMVMGWLDDSDLEWAVENGIEFYVFDTGRLEKAVSIAAKLSKPARIHIEMETGMNRTGMVLPELKKAARIILQNRNHIELTGLCTHLAGAESVANHVRIQKQLGRFKRLSLFFRENGLVPVYMHAASSAAAITYPASRFNMVRVGIMQYGYWPSPETFIQFLGKRRERKDPLTRVINWKSWIMSVKNINRGEFISYGTVYLAQEDKKIAVVPVGYSHGYSRSLSNRGRVLINGCRIAVIGMVNMNMLIADVTGLNDVRTGDEVVLIGEQKGMTLSVASFGEFSNQLNYELLTRLPGNIQRVVVDKI